MIVEQYHNLVIGSGEAGKYLAWNLAKLGQKTAMVERSMIGGSCPNIAACRARMSSTARRPFRWSMPTAGLGVVTGCNERRHGRRRSSQTRDG